MSENIDVKIPSDNVKVLMLKGEKGDPGPQGPAGEKGDPGQIENLGGTNLLSYDPQYFHSDFENNYDYYYNGLLVIGGNYRGDYENPIYSESKLSREFIEGERYTFSFYAQGHVKLAVFCEDFNYGIRVVKTNGTIAPESEVGTEGTKAGMVYFTPYSNWERYFVTWEVTKYYGTANFIIFNRGNKNDYGYVCGIKLEKGEIITDWSPSVIDQKSGLCKNVVYGNNSPTGEEVNDFVFLNDHFVKVTAPIAELEQYKPSNCVKTYVGDELKNLYKEIDTLKASIEELKASMNK